MINNLLEILIDNIPYSVWLRDTQGKFLVVNKYYADVLNLEKEDIVGKTLYDLYPKDSAKEYDSNYEEVIKYGEPRLFSGYSDEIFLECYIAPIKQDNQIKMFIGILQNQTERKKYEEQIIKQKDLLETLINTIPDCVFYKNREGKYLDCNVAFATEYYDKNKKDILGKTDIEIRETLNINSGAIDDIMDLDKKKVKYMESIKAPILKSNGDVEGIVGVARDVTKTVILEKKLKNEL